MTTINLSDPRTQRTFKVVNGGMYFPRRSSIWAAYFAVRVTELDDRRGKRVSRLLPARFRFDPSNHEAEASALRQAERYLQAKAAQA